MTVNGIGTMYYDWHRRDDGTAEATAWFVVFFFPILPLRREHLLIVNSSPEGGTSFTTTLQLLGQVPLSAFGVLRTYLKGFLLVPFITFVGPILLMVASLFLLTKFGFDAQQVMNKIAPFYGIGVLIWAAVIISRILDRSSGRFLPMTGENDSYN